MAKPLVAIVGRPNVGKSTFFNKVTGKKVSIVEDVPGVTRDRIYVDSDWNGYAFTLVDTGGLELKSEDKMHLHIKHQAQIAIDMADVVIFFTDIKSGVTKQDEDVASFLRKSKKPIVLGVNKMDNYDPVQIAEFYSLGLGEPYGVSSEHGLGIGDLLDAVVNNLKTKYVEEDESDVVRIAIVGKPNAGKSSITNKLLGYDRTIVSEVAGTTRDAIDTPFELNGKKYCLIDTAGIRKNKSDFDDIEYYSVLRSYGAIRRADVCLLVIDSVDGITEQDLKIAGYIHEQGKPSVIVMNKWDLVEKDTHTINKFEAELSEELKFMSYFKSIYVSAKTGQRLEKAIALVDYVNEKANFRATTGVLNDVIGDAVRMNEAPQKAGKRLKIYFATQVSVRPPTFVLKVNDRTLTHFSYERYLENNIRKAFSLDGTPIRILLKNKVEKE